MSEIGELRPGAAFGRYRIEGAIGRGGMGIVYRARETALDRVVALKVIAPGLVADTSFRERFRREARMAAALDHPNILPVYAADLDGDQPFIATRLINGSDLGALVARVGPLPVERALVIAERLAAALDAAHDAGLVHRDVKPANVLIGPDSRAGDPSVHLTDFGLTREQSGGGLTQHGMLVGTVEYMAPEQVEGRALDGRADQYALAVTVFEALTGKLPFESTTITASLLAKARDTPRSIAEYRSDVPVALDEVFQRALAVDPNERYPSCADFAAACRLAATGTVAPPAVERRATVIAPLDELEPVAETIADIPTPLPTALAPIETPPPTQAPVELPAEPPAVTPPPSEPVTPPPTTRITPLPIPGTTIGDVDRAPTTVGRASGGGRSRTPQIAAGAALAAAAGVGAVFLLTRSGDESNGTTSAAAPTSSSSIAGSSLASVSSVATTVSTATTTATSETTPTTESTPSTSTEAEPEPGLLDEAKLGWPDAAAENPLAFVGTVQPVKALYRVNAQSSMETVINGDDLRLQVLISQAGVPTTYWSRWRGSRLQWGCKRVGSGAIRCNGRKSRGEHEEVRSGFFGVVYGAAVQDLARAAYKVRRRGGQYPSYCAYGTAQSSLLGRRVPHEVCVEHYGIVTSVRIGDIQVKVRRLQPSTDPSDFAPPRR